MSIPSSATEGARLSGACRERAVQILRRHSPRIPLTQGGSPEADLWEDSGPVIAYSTSRFRIELSKEMELAYVH